MTAISVSPYRSLEDLFVLLSGKTLEKSLSMQMQNINLSKRINYNHLYTHTHTGEGEQCCEREMNLFLRDDLSFFFFKILKGACTQK